MKEYYIFKLKNINLQDRINHFPPEFEFNVDFGYLIIHFVLEQMANRIDKNKFSYLYREFNPLDSRILQSYMHNYNEHIRYLGENFPLIGNIFERRDYKEGRCYSYRLQNYYHDIQVEAYLITDKVLLRKLKKKSILNVPKIINKHYNFLVEYFDSNRLTIEFEKALNLNSDKLEEEGNMKKYLINAFKILKIKNGAYYMSLDPLSDGRFHSNITGFPKEFRKFLKYDGENLVEVDVSASVPTFFYYFLENFQKNNSFSSYFSHLDFIITKNKYYYNHYMLVKNSVRLDDKEIQDFGDKIFSGQFYPSFIPIFKEFYVLENSYYEWQFQEFNFPQSSFINYGKTLRPKEPTLDDIKNTLLSMLNAKNGLFDLEELGFKSLFPTISEFLKSFKKTNHKYFSHLMLQIESYFMLSILARKLSNKFKKKIPVFTLHDCIITTESNLNTVFEFMQKAFKTELGFIPVLKTKVWK